MKKKSIKTAAAVLVSAALSVLLCSCFDITHAIALRDGRYYVSVKCGFDRNMLYLAGTDEDVMADDLDRYDAQWHNSPYNVTFDRINAGNETGFFLTFDCSEDVDVTGDLGEFLPYRDRRGWKFPLIIGEEIGSAEVDDPLDIATMVLSIAKYRLIIDKSVVGKISSAAINEKDSRRSVDVKFYDFGTFYMIDVPISTLYGSKRIYSDVVVR